MSSTIAFGRVSRNISRPPFVVDQKSIMRDGGHQIDWDALGESYVADAAVATLSALVDKDATSISVTALPQRLQAGTELDFGAVPAQVVTTSGAIATATAVPVTALTAPIRSGTILDFTGTGKFAKLTANAAIGATSLTVEALDAALANGNTATVEAYEAIVEVSEDAEVGATTVNIVASDFFIPSGSTAHYGGTEFSLLQGNRMVRAGTVMDLQADGTIVPSALGTGGVTAFCILETNAFEDAPTDAATGYGCIVQGQIFENLLPEASGGPPKVITSAWKTELLARGGAWMFFQYSDDTSA